MGEKMPPWEQAMPPKSYGDRPQSQSQLPTAVPEVVHGRLTEAEWLELLEAECTDADVSAIVSELVTRVLDECSRAHAIRQRVPFTVEWVRAAILHMVHWHFLPRDEGDTGTQEDTGAWHEEDKEPLPVAIDAWAHGCVPVLPGPLPLPQDPPKEIEDRAAPMCPGQVPSTGHILPVPVLPCPDLGDATAAAQSPSPQPVPLHWTRSIILHLAPRQRRCRPQSPHKGTTGDTSHVAPLPPPPPPSCASQDTMKSGSPLHNPRKGPSTTLEVPRLVPRSHPKRWIRPQVEVLDFNAQDLPHAQDPRGYC